MKIVKLTFFYLAIILLALTLSLAGVRLSISLGIFALIAVGMIYRHIHILYRTNNMEQVDKWVKITEKSLYLLLSMHQLTGQKRNRFRQSMSSSIIISSQPLSTITSLLRPLWRRILVLLK